MGRILKYLSYAIGALVVLLLIGGIMFTFLFDPNDYRENIATQVKRSTGRDLVIEGNLSLKLFPWLAVEIGRSSLSNAEGFGDAPFASFDAARLSVRLMPLLLRREIVVGAVNIDALSLDLAVNAQGVGNWQDLAGQGDDESVDAEMTTSGTLDIGSIDISNANLSYTDSQLKERYQLANLNIATGSVTTGEPIDIRSSFEFDAQPAGVAGIVEIATTVVFDTDAALIAFNDLTIDAEVNGLADVPTPFAFSAPAITLNTADSTADVGNIDVSMFDIKLRADIEAFSYADTPTPTATISIDAFSPRSLMQSLNIEAPETADPAALGKLIVDADAAVTEKHIELTKLVLVLDETTFKGKLIVPRAVSGVFRLELAGDNIDLNRYMAPAGDADASAGGAAEAPVEIPAEMIRALNVRGNLTLGKATMGSMQFENVEVGIKVNKDRLRMHPISAEFFGGGYKGDIRINASKAVPVLAVNEQIHDVSMRALGQAMFQRDNLSGTIDGSFKLRGVGNDMGQIQRTLKGDMSFTLKDGAWEGVDVWYQLRNARAQLRNETPPKPVLPARTPFTEVRATGKVKDGILRNNDFYAELPFMQLNGRGSVNLPAATVDYSLSGRVFDRPEYVKDVTPDELADLTRVQIPLRITGPLASPRIGVDLDELLKEAVKEEIEEKLTDELKDKLKDLFKR
jgi:AsmA protein